MRRLHLFEFEDQAWFPPSIRNYGTDFLQFVSNRFGLYKSIVPIVAKGLEKSGGQQVIDIASGGGGPWLSLLAPLRTQFPALKVCLTDYYPNEAAFQHLVAQAPDVFHYEANPVSALAIPDHLRGFRTQFLSLHHFQPEAARQILQHAVAQGAVIGVFEAQERDWKHVLQFLFSPINVLLVTPFIRPFRWGRLLFTYLIPIVPLFVLWDGVVSALRTYTLAEMLEMTEAVDPEGRYHWEIEKVTLGPIRLPYLLGYPK